MDTDNGVDSGEEQLAKIRRLELEARVDLCIAAAEERAWKWVAGYELEYWLVTWHRGGGVFETEYAFAVPPDGDLLHTINGRAIFLTEAHLPIFERFMARGVQDLPAALKERVMVMVPDMTRGVSFFLVEAMGAKLEFPTRVFVPVLGLRKMIDTDAESAIVPGSDGAS